MQQYDNLQISHTVPVDKIYYFELPDIGLISIRSFYYLAGHQTQSGMFHLLVVIAPVLSRVAVISIHAKSMLCILLNGMIKINLPGSSHI